MDAGRVKRNIAEFRLTPVDVIKHARACPSVAIAEVRRIRQHRHATTSDKLDERNARQRSPALRLYFTAIN